MTHLFVLCSPLFFPDEYLVLPSGNLQIVSVSAEHQGMYKCGAFNPVTGETVFQSHGTKLFVKSKSEDTRWRLPFLCSPSNASLLCVQI